MAQAGPQSGALVYDLDADDELYGLRPTIKRPPASVEKLWTTTALMDKLGPSARLHTTVLGTGSLRHGVWHGNLYLRGGGDPTFGDPTFNRVWELGYGPTAAQLTQQLAKRGITRVTGQVFADEIAVRPQAGRADDQLPARHARLRRPAQRADLRPRRHRPALQPRRRSPCGRWRW